jgi:hypothetical protein
LYGEIVNRWQIICPLAALAVFLMAVAMIAGHRNRGYYLHAQAWNIGKDLIASTNSELLVQMDSGLARRLSSFLSLSSAVAEVKLGDEPPPIGDGTASTRLILSNAHGERLGIRLCQDSVPEKFRVVGSWSIAEPVGALKRSEPRLPEANRGTSQAGSGR